MKIIARLADPEFSNKYRNGKYTLNSMWEWGIGDDGQVYYRDIGSLSINKCWGLLINMVPKLEIHTMVFLQEWYQVRVRRLVESI